jgi:hypothetical protein
MPPETSLHAPTGSSYQGDVIPLPSTHSPYNQFDGVKWVRGTIGGNSQDLYPVDALQQSIIVSAHEPPKDDPFRIITKENIESGYHHKQLKHIREEGGYGREGKKRKSDAVSGSRLQNHNAPPPSQQIPWNETYRPPMLGRERGNTVLPSEPYLIGMPRC